AGGPRHADRLAPAARGRLESAAQQPQLLLVVHERNDASAHAEPRANVAAEDEMRARLIDLPEVEAPLQKWPRRLAHHDRLRRAEREQVVEHRDGPVSRVDVDLLPLHTLRNERFGQVDRGFEGRADAAGPAIEAPPGSQCVRIRSVTTPNRNARLHKLNTASAVIAAR